ncbi:MAG TPA: AMP-binding protein [Chakrabartia sp.]|jgi:malonyl-CoA/methylmalonyl-CoA synthetase|nr:AMP-binding protein [Chakrabartia sp.]
MPASLFEAFAAQADARGDAPALLVDDGSTFSYAELRVFAGRFATAMRARGVVPGDRVVVQVEKSAAAVALYLACLQAGAVFVPLNTAYTDAEVQYFLDDSQPALFVHDPARNGIWAQSVALGQDEASPFWAEALAQQPDLEIAPRASGDIAATCYTSGTTGRSKGAMISHGNMLSNAETLISLWRFTPADRLLHILPIFHVHGLFVALHCALLSGAAIRFERGFDVARVRALLPLSTVMMGVPTHYTRLLGDAAFGQADCAAMRLFLCGSAPLLAETHVQFTSRTGHRILERYGMTEAGMITSNPYEGERVAGTVGFMLPGVEGRVRDGEGALVGPDQVGTLEIKGPNVFAGYWQMPDKTEESFTADGWFITGDLVTMAADGRVTIVGRAKDLIIAGGYNIYPKEIESVIDDMPGVEESAVVGVPHPDFGESVVAVIVPKAGSVVTPDQVLAWVAERLARFKHPRAVHVVDALPRNTMGKVQKAELRKTYGGG